ncbi:hypothetical protein D8674_037940 [Pyrus ussuriensis x Pyrus communis]|uniref:Uncharacterized protein n=1 Tax=Pyrus ussuriensis x Pyrus communis TaxID=2448454 RepID=A0A5N5FTB1_9ROSA|nr:hypothetical protein D8674_037940 [Pyrus ussuriensis x Pyrus communis]
MAYYRRSQTSSFLEGFSLSPLPYPVLLILAVISIFLGISWYSSYESAVEEAEGQFNWVLLLTPIFLILIVKGLSYGSWLALLHVAREAHLGVAAFIILLLVLLQYQSSFRDSWLI